MRALIVEDHPLIRRVLVEALTSHFPLVEVAAAADVAAGGQEASRHPPAFALIDVNLPDGSGLSLVEPIKRLAPRSMIVVWTSSPLSEYRDAAEARGAAHFLVKGDTGIDEILGLVKEAIRRHEARGEDN